MKRQVSRLFSETGGAVAGTVAISLFALVAIGGVAFDYARMAALDTELQNAADQAALAAASQLDGENGACARAVEAARGVVTNNTLMANDNAGLPVTVADSTVCGGDGVTITDATGASVRFFQNKAATILATTVAEAKFVQVAVNTRRANYALTPIVAAFTSGNLGASARAGVGTALCKVPPLMVCPPTSSTIDWNLLRGHGIRAVSNTGANWAPGAFGYIGPQDANSTQIGLAFQNPVFQCQQIEGDQPVSTGAPTPAIVAINSRFDIYDMSNGSGTALAPCHGTACPPALNVVKDLIRAGNASGGNACKIHNNGWKLPTNMFRPRLKNAADTAMTPIHDTTRPAFDAMGLPRDNIHYCSYNAGGACNTNRFGDGAWARGDYFNKYHTGHTLPANVATITRYETYLWEIANNLVPNDVVASGTGAGSLRQYGRAVCNATTPDPARDRRVLQVAVGGNCADLRGASTPVQINKWIEVFLVEPGVPGSGRGNGDGGNEIYLEVIREVDPGGPAAQVIRRDMPYLVR